MADYKPPTENLPIFDSSVFKTTDVGLTQSDADNRYLRYPNAQGTENLQQINVNGAANFNSDVDVNAVLRVFDNAIFDDFTFFNAVSSFTDNVVMSDNLTVGGIINTSVYTNIYYVSKGGNDANAGTMLAPKLTIQSAIDTGNAAIPFAPFVVYISNGTFTENITITQQCALIGIEFDADFLDSYSSNGNIPNNIYSIIDGNITTTVSANQTPMTFSNIYCKRYINTVTSAISPLITFSNCIFEYSTADTNPLLDLGTANTQANYYFYNCIFIRQNASNTVFINNAVAVNKIVVSDFNRCRFYVSGTMTQPVFTLYRRIVFNYCEFTIDTTSLSQPVIFIPTSSTGSSPTLICEFTHFNINTSVSAGFNLFQYNGNPASTTQTVTLTNNIYNINGMVEGTNYIYYNQSTTKSITLLWTNNYLYPSTISTYYSTAGGAINLVQLRKTELLNMGGNDIINAKNIGCERIIPSINFYQTVYYVTKQGSDSANGTFYTPFLTIQKAITEGELAGVPYCIKIGSGTYTENLVITNSVQMEGFVLTPADNVFNVNTSNLYATIGGSITGNFTSTVLIYLSYLNITDGIFLNSTTGGNIQIQYSRITTTSDTRVISINTSSTSAFFSIACNDCDISNGTNFVGSPINLTIGTLYTQFDFRFCRFILRSNSTDAVNDAYLKLARRGNLTSNFFTCAGNGLGNGLPPLRLLRGTGSGANDNVFITDNTILISTTGYTGSILTMLTTVDNRVNFYFENNSFTVPDWTDGVNYLIKRDTAQGTIGFYNRNTALYTNNDIDGLTAISNFTSGTELFEFDYKQISNINMSDRNITNVGLIRSNAYFSLDATSDINLNAGGTGGRIAFNGGALTTSGSVSITSEKLRVIVNGTEYFIPLYS